MLYLKEINYEDIEKEYLFVRDMPIDENGLTNEWHGISREEFEEKTIRQMIAYVVSSVMVLGIAGGNGLEHIDKNKYQKVYGI